MGEGRDGDEGCPTAGKPKLKMRLALILILCTVIVLASIAGTVAASAIFGTVEVTATANIVALPQDVDGNGCVDGWDLYLVAQDLGVQVPQNWITDLNGDQAVDVSDLSSVARVFGAGACS